MDVINEARHEPLFDVRSEVNFSPRLIVRIETYSEAGVESSESPAARNPFAASGEPGSRSKPLSIWNTESLDADLAEKPTAIAQVLR